MKWLAAAVCAVVLAPGAAQAKWLRAESPQFIVYSNGAERGLRNYVADLEVFDALLKARHNTPAGPAKPRKLTVYLVKDTAELQQTSNVSNQVAGYYSASMDDIFAVAIRDSEDDATLKHEYAHHFMQQHFAAGYPAWFAEGFAEYYASATISERTLEVGQYNNRIYSVLDVGQMPTAQLLNQRPDELSGDQMHTFYGTAWLLTHYLFSDPTRYAQMQKYLEAVFAGGQPVQAMEAALGMSTTDLDKALRRYLEGSVKFVRYPRKALAMTEPTITVTEAPPSADALLLDRLHVLSRQGQRDMQSIALLGRIRASAAQYPNDRLATLTLAEAELDLGEQATGITQLETWVKANPKDAEAMSLLGSALYRRSGQREGSAADLKRADALLGAAIGLAPEDYRALAYAGLTLEAEEGKPSELSQQLLLQAYVQAKQVSELRLMLAETLLSRGQGELAVTVLTPLANSPHGGPAADAARRRLARLERK